MCVFCTEAKPASKTKAEQLASKKALLDKRLQDVQSTLKGNQSAGSPTPGSAAAAGSGTTSSALSAKSGTPQLAAAVAGKYLLYTCFITCCFQVFP